MKFVTSRTRALIVSAVLILAIAIIVPVSAKNPTRLEASGTIDGYVDAWSAMIVSGHWSVTVKEGVLQYTAMYHELNLDEGVEHSLVGSVDIFTHTFTSEPDDYELKDNVLTFSGTIERWKVWSKDDGTTEPVLANQLVSITITKDTFYLDTDPTGPGPSPDGQDWDRYGKTNYFK
jgi:hypothetical protein